MTTNNAGLSIAISFSKMHTASPVCRMISHPWSHVILTFSLCFWHFYCHFTGEKIEWSRESEWNPQGSWVSKGQDRTWAHVMRTHIWCLRVSFNVKQLFVLEGREGTGGGNPKHTASIIQFRLCKKRNSSISHPANIYWTTTRWEALS